MMNIGISIFLNQQKTWTISFLPHNLEEKVVKRMNENFHQVRTSTKLMGFSIL